MEEGHKLNALLSDNYPYAYLLSSVWEGVDAYILTLARDRFRFEVQLINMAINRQNALHRMDLIRQRLENGTIDIHMPRAHVSRSYLNVDVAAAYEWEALVLVVPKSDQLNLTNIMLQPFTIEVWTIVLGYLLVRQMIKLFSFFKRRCNRFNIRKTLTCRWSFGSFGSLTTVGVELVSFLLIEAYLAKITEFLLYCRFQSDPQTLDEFFRSTIPVLIPEYMDPLVEALGPTVAANFHAKLIRPDEYAKRAASCCARIHTLPRAEYVVRMGKYFDATLGRKQLYILPEQLKIIPMSYLLGRNFAFKNSFELFLLGVHESGLIGRYVTAHRKDMAMMERNFFTKGWLTLADLLPLFVLVGAGWCCSFAAFLSEVFGLRTVERVQPHQAAAVPHDMFHRLVGDRFTALEIEQPQAVQIAAQVQHGLITDTLARVHQHVLQMGTVAHERRNARLRHVQPPQIDLLQQREPQRHQRLIGQIPAVAQVKVAQLAQVRDRVEPYPLERHHDRVEHVPVEEAIPNVDRPLQIQILQPLQVRKRQLQIVYVLVRALVEREAADVRAALEKPWQRVARKHCRRHEQLLEGGVFVRAQVEIALQLRRVRYLQIVQLRHVGQKRPVQVGDAGDPQLDALHLRQKGTEGLQELFARGEQVFQVEVHDRRLQPGQQQDVVLLDGEARFQRHLAQPQLLDAPDLLQYHAGRLGVAERDRLQGGPQRRDEADQLFAPPLVRGKGELDRFQVRADALEQVEQRVVHERGPYRERVQPLQAEVDRCVVDEVVVKLDRFDRQGAQIVARAPQHAHQRLAVDCAVAERQFRQLGADRSPQHRGGCDRARLEAHFLERAARAAQHPALFATVLYPEVAQGQHEPTHQRTVANHYLVPVSAGLAHRGQIGHA
uniref:Uncharacterized protein n=1 Tax=Anopheles coluzzii TaxID=1518534 RepID=A0A8W7PYD1_ANOCL